MYLVQRSTQSPVLAGFWVFPGGTLRTDDYDAKARYHSPKFGPAAAHAALTRGSGYPASSPEESLAFFVAAARELFEETGVLLGSASSQTSTPGSSSEARAVQRLELEHGATLTALALEIGLDLTLDDLIYYGHWITPETIPQRFDTRFFIAVLPDGQAPQPSPYEVAEAQWIEPSAALERHRAGDLKLHFATLKHIQRLAPYSRLSDLLVFAGKKGVVPVMPLTRERNGQVLPYLEPELDGAW
jgi:8-oxo-dGTP pyrophosphatase MutT (NUDIX family)